MKLNYKIYGCTLELEFQNDLILLEHLKNQVGKFIEQDNSVTTDARFMFKKTSAFELKKMYDHFVFDRVVRKSKIGYLVKGDNNWHIDPVILNSKDLLVLKEVSYKNRIWETNTTYSNIINKIFCSYH